MRQEILGMASASGLWIGICVLYKLRRERSHFGDVNPPF